VKRAPARMGWALTGLRVRFRVPFCRRVRNAPTVHERKPRMRMVEIIPAPATDLRRGDPS
jgi:hypothetical protein